MAGPCVRVDCEDGERTRRLLADDDLIDETREIVSTDDYLYIPVSDPDAVPERFAVVERSVPKRETQTTPADLLEFSPSYERLGDVVIVDEDDPERAEQLAEAIVASDIPCETVLNRASKIQGERRVRDWELLYGEHTEAVHREYGYEFALDLAAVYFSPRLATERHRVVDQVESDDRVFDMFAGVGPFAVPMAGRGASVVATDINDVAIEYCRENARRNGVDDRLTAIHSDVREIAPEYAGWADRIVMNLPHSADEFLDTAVALAGEECVLHYYDIQHEDDPFGPGTRAIEEAAAGYEMTVETERVVRSYAPHEYNVALDVRLSRSV